MITPENSIPADDAQNDDVNDQRSQQDIHSNGLNETDIEQEEEQAPIDMLEQAYEASTPSYTLHLDDEPKEDD